MEINRRPLVCVPICEKDFGAVAQATTGAAGNADLIEIRLDCLEPLEFEQSAEKLDELLSNAPRPAVVTYRPAEQGGSHEFDAKTRLRFWLFQRPSNAEFLDIELDVAADSALFDYGEPLDWSHVICSHHDFQGVPGNLGQIYERMTRTPARILKVAVTANDITDCIPVFNLLDRARAEGREIIAIAMGRAGVLTRVLGPSRGAFLTYGSLEKERATAPGQVTASELRQLYRIDKINRDTKITGLVGWPVSHSISPHIHNAGFEATDFDGVYLPLEVHDIDQFMATMVHPGTRRIDWNLLGLSVTAPHKSVVMRFLDWIEPEAEEIGAVNTIVIRADQLCGYNTDAGAFAKTLTRRLGELRGARCAVIGAGGAANAAVWSLRKEQANVTVFARDLARARSVAEKPGAAWKHLGNEKFSGYDVVINATPLGTSGTDETATPAIAEQLIGTRLAYDLVYNPRETAFQREARAAGCEVIGGLDMLVTQAAEQFRLWTGLDAPEEVMLEAADKALKNERTLQSSDSF